MPSSSQEVTTTTLRNLTSVELYVPVGRQGRFVPPGGTFTVFGDVLSGYYGEETAKAIARMIVAGKLEDLTTGGGSGNVPNPDDDSAWDAIGDLNDLTTFDKDTLVDAINEVNAKVPDFSGAMSITQYNLTSQLNGSTKVFTIPTSVESTDFVMVFYEGLLQTPGPSDTYTLDCSAHTLTWHESTAPDGGDGRDLIMIVFKIG